MKRPRTTVTLTTPWTRLLLLFAGAALFLPGCAAQPVLTQSIYEDRSAWIWLETTPDMKEGSPDVSMKAVVAPSPAALAALLKGFRVEKDYNVGVVGMMMGKSVYGQAFVEPEIQMLAVYIAKGLANASPNERVAYCMTADFSYDERFITTGWAYVKGPYLHFKLNEYRTTVSVSSPAASTSTACRTKPKPGYKTADRFFKLDYEPKDMVVTHGLVGGTIFNHQGEVMFKLASLRAAQPSDGQNAVGTTSATLSGTAKSLSSPAGGRATTAESLKPSESQPTGNPLSPQAREIVNQAYRSLPPQSPSPIWEQPKPPSRQKPKSAVPAVGPEPRNPPD